METRATSLEPRAFAASLGEIVAEFGEHSQDSGNISYIVRAADGRRTFIKTAGRTDDHGRWYLSHGQRVALLRNAVAVSAAAGTHPAAPRLEAVVESPAGPLLVYEWRPGELLTGTRAQPESPYQRFRALAPERIVAALDAIIGLHAVLAAQGWVAVDFYAASLIYDFDAQRITVVDLDSYHRGPFTNTMGRMFGSTRFMAPEEFRLGATIDQRTTVFTLGRLLAVMLGDETLDRAAFRGGDELHAVMLRACAEAPDARYPEVAAFSAAWRAARSG